MLHGDTRLSKSSPLKYLEAFLTEYALGCKNKWVVLDQGGELYNNPTINKLFRKIGYKILPTSPDALFQNGPGKRSYLTISQGIKALLIGSGLDVKFWPYVFMHFLCIYNALPDKGQDLSPLFLSTGNKFNCYNYPLL